MPIANSATLGGEITRQADTIVSSLKQSTRSKRSFV